MNIGKWIVVVFIIFAAFIAVLITICVYQDISLVSKDYYREELAYQSQIQRLNNTASLSEKPMISVVDQKLKLSFQTFDKVENGVLKLFCPSNREMDRSFSVKSSSTESQLFD